MAACLVLLAVSGWAAVDKPEKMTDRQINNVVENAILTDAALANSQIDVKTTEGIVILTGTVYNLVVKERAANLAKIFRGVRGVINQIQLRNVVVTDEELAKNVLSALFYDAATDSYEIKSEAKDGVVTLSGTVQSYHEKNLAIYVAKEVRGVKDVKDSVTVKTRNDRRDSEISAEVKRIIDIDVWLNHEFIDIEVKKGVVILTGRVGSAAQYHRASLRAWTAGVKAVNAEGLRIEDWVSQDGQRSEINLTRNDSQTSQAVKDAFLYDPRVLSFNPVVDVENGVVTLTGTVENLRAKRAAEQDAKNTVGVWRIKNLLKVRPVTPLADDKIAREVKLAFLRDSFVDSYQIEVKVKLGVVTLSGTVDSFFEKAQADSVASRASGVTDVYNNIIVNYPTAGYYNTADDLFWSIPSSYSYYPPYNTSLVYSSDAVVKNDIENELFWSPFVDRERIVVTVEKGVATLSGTVGSWFDFGMATEYAYKGGARLVYNKLVVN